MSSKTASTKTTRGNGASHTTTKKAQTSTPVATIPTPVEVAPKKVKKTTAVAPPVIPVVAVTPVVTVADEEETDKKTVNTTTTSSKDEVISVVSTVVQKLKEEAQRAKTRKDKESLAVLNEQIKSLNSVKKPIDKLARSKPPRKQINIDKSRNGILKQLSLSPELKAFLGYNVNDDVHKSRVEVTRAICKYIIDNNLQNPENRREILLDDKLQKLFKYDPSVETEPFMYYHVQVYVKSGKDCLYV